MTDDQIDIEFLRDLPNLPDGFNLDLAETLGELAGTVERLNRMSVAEIDTPDTLGLIGHSQSKLATFVKNLKAELPIDRHTVIKGGGYEIVAANTAKRTYNTPRLIADLAFPYEAPISTLLRLVADDVIRINWQWSNLKAAMADAGNSLQIDTDLALEDATVTLDDPHVGEKWTSKPNVKGIVEDA